MNPFDGVSDTDLIGLSTQWLLQRPEDDADLPGWQDDLAALKAERDRRRGE